MMKCNMPGTWITVKSAFLISMECSVSNRVSNIRSTLLENTAKLAGVCEQDRSNSNTISLDILQLLYDNTVDHASVYAGICACVYADLPISFPSHVKFHFPLQVPANFGNLGWLSGQIKH